MSCSREFLLIEIINKSWTAHRMENPIQNRSKPLDISISETGFGMLDVEDPFSCGIFFQRYAGEAYFNVNIRGMVVAEAVVVWDALRWPELKGRIRRCFSHDPYRPTTYEELEQYLSGEIAVLPSADWNRTLELRNGMTLPKRCPAETFVVLMTKQVARHRISPEQAEPLRKLVAEVAQGLIQKALSKEPS